ncbi:ABC transporter ATP-binding protein [Gaetbulibacter aestuarii]|uniref:ABC transporter ATP-binding protein n=1 Tax=Gaetbulibacter aestuarii TaxID=1502358 RepID=A0ABW7MW48_9FLAO
MIFNAENNLIKQFIASRKSNTLLVLFLGLLSNLLTIIIPVSIGRYYQLVFHFKGYRTRFLGEFFYNLTDSVPRFLVVFLILILLRFAFYFGYQFTLKREGEIFIKQVKDYLFSHQLFIHNSIYKEKGIGKYLLRYSGDINSLKNLYIKGTISAFLDVVMIILALWWLYLLNVKGTTAIIVLSLFFYGGIYLLNKKVEESSIQKRNKTSGQLAFVSRALNSIIGVVLFNKQDLELKKYQKKSDSVKEAAISYNKWLILNKGFVYFSRYAILMVVLYIFYLDIQNGVLTGHGATLISFILLYITISPVVRRLFTLNTVYKIGNISVHKLHRIIALERETVEHGAVLKVRNPRVTIEDFSIRKSMPLFYRSEKMAYSPLVLPGGLEGIALIYAFGGVENDYKGSIQINGVDIRSYSLMSIRHNIAFLSRDIPLIGQTVYEAVSAFRAKRIRGKVEKQFLEIQALFPKVQPLGVDDSIGENGSKLSVMQYELLCLIRGLLLKKRIILADHFPSLEATYKRVIIDLLKAQKATVIHIDYKA